MYCLLKKSEAFPKFKTWLAMVERETGKLMKCLRSDNGGEYTSTEFKQFCDTKGIKRHFTVPNTPQQNGVAERMNRTLDSYLWLRAFGCKPIFLLCIGVMQLDRMST